MIRPQKTLAKVEVCLCAKFKLGSDGNQTEMEWEEKIKERVQRALKLFNCMEI